MNKISIKTIIRSVLFVSGIVGVIVISYVYDHIAILWMMACSILGAFLAHFIGQVYALRDQLNKTTKEMLRLAEINENIRISGDFYKKLYEDLASAEEESLKDKEGKDE